MASTAVDRICTKLDGLKKNGAGWVGKCPAHDDHHQSLSISEGADGRALLKCHAGCPTSTIVSALGLRFVDLFPTTTQAVQAASSTGLGQIVATYPYKDPDGALMYEVVRFSPKTFRPRRPDGNGGWVWNMTGVQRIPYRLHQLKDVVTVLIPEGEKDCDKLWTLGFPATTNVGGAGKWRTHETMALKAAGVQRAIILPDADEAGKKHAEDVYGRLRGAGIAASIVTLPGLGSHGDVSDWLADGHTKAELEGLIAKPYVVPPEGTPAPLPPAVEPDLSPDDLESLEAKKLTQARFAAEFASLHSQLYRHDIRRKGWMQYQSPRWAYDPGKTVRRAMLKFVQQRHRDALRLTDYERRQKLVKFCLQAESKTSIEQLVSMAEWNELLQDNGEHWDEQPMLLSVPNGVIDLTTGELRPGTPTDKLTMLAGVPYHPDAECRRWWQFLSEVFDGDPELIDFAQKLCGYMLTGMTTEQVIVMCYGPGGNGKSLFLNTLRLIAGEYATTLPFSSLSAQAADAVSNDLAALQGRRIVAASEINEGVRLNEARLKSLTGGDEISARFLYSEHFTFVPVAKFILSVNHKPVVRDDSHGFWRRVRLLPFMVKFEGDARDPFLAAKLKEEAIGILAWAIQGCLLWQKEGLPMPASVREATDEYAADSDPLNEFLRACCDVLPDETCTASELYKAYDSWCTNERLTKWDRMTSTSFGRAMGTRFKKKHTAGGSIYIGVDVRLVPGR